MATLPQSGSQILLLWLCSQFCLSPVSPSDANPQAIDGTGRRLATLEALMPVGHASGAAIATRNNNPGEEAWYGIGSQWEKMDTGTQHWSARSQFGTVVHDGKVFLMGGLSSAEVELNDVWSFDGSSWELQSEAAPWDPRRNFAVVMHLGYLYVLGGRTDGGLVNDVWRGIIAENGIFFEQRKRVDQNAQTPFSTRERALALSFQGEIYLFGGCRDGLYGQECAMALKQVLQSTDGERWTRSKLADEQPANLPDYFQDQPYQLMGVALEECMLVIGGNTVAAVHVLESRRLEIAEIHSSTSGAWKLGRSGVALGVASLVFVLGGQTQNGGRTNRVVFSHDDGRSWQDIPSPSQQELLFPPRTDFAGVVHQGRLCILGGVAGSVTFSDMWCSIKPLLSPPALVATSVGDGARTSEDWFWDSVTWTLDPAPVPPEVEAEQEFRLSLQWMSGWQSEAFVGAVQWALPEGEVEMLVTAQASVALSSSAPLRASAQSSWAQARVLRALAAPKIDTLAPQFPPGRDSGTVTVSCPKRGIVPIEVVACVTHPPKAVNSTTCWPGQPSVRVAADAGASVIRAQCSAEGWPISDVAVFEVVSTLNPDAQTSMLEEVAAPTSASPPETTSPPPIPSTTHTTAAPSAVVWSVDVCCDRSCAEVDDAARKDCSRLNTTGGSTVRIRGQGLGGVQAVLLGERECVELRCPASKFSAASECFCAAPAGVGAAELRVELVDGGVVDTSGLAVLRYADAQILWLYPRHGAALGGEPVTVTGANLGAVLAGHSAEGAGPWSVAGYDVAVTVGSSRATAAEWRSDSSMVLRTAAGVGGSLPVMLTMERQSATALQRFSYDVPEVRAAAPPFGPPEGGLEVTILGKNFGGERETLESSVGAERCRFTLWTSDSSASCSFPPHQGQQPVSVRVGVGAQWGELSGGYQYTGASAPVALTTTASPEELEQTGRSGKSKLEELREWVQGSLALPDLAQVYVARVERVLFRRSADLAGSRVVMRILGSRTDPDGHQEALEILTALVEQGSAAFATSFVAIARIQLPGQPEVILDGRADTVAADGKEEDGGGGGGAVVAAAAAAGGVLVTLAVLCVFRHRLKESLSWECLQSPRPQPRADSVFVQPSPSFRTLRHESSRLDSFKSSFVDSPDKGRGPMCDQCQRSGFRVCVHSAAVKQGSRKQLLDGDDFLCVVCLDQQRTAVVIHDDEEKTAHQVLCLDCANRIFEEGGGCPMCRKPILEVCQG